MFCKLSLRLLGARVESDEVQCMGRRLEQHRLLVEADFADLCPPDGECEHLVHYTLIFILNACLTVPVYIHSSSSDEVRRLVNNSNVTDGFGERLNLKRMVVRVARVRHRDLTNRVAPRQVNRPVSGNDGCVLLSDGERQNRRESR